MKRIAIAATILCLNLATMSAAAQGRATGAQGAAGLGRVTETEPDDAPFQVRLSDDLNLEGVELDPELLRALAELERNRELFNDPIYTPHYTRTRYSTASYSSGAGGRLALRLIPLGIGLIALIVRAGRKNG